LTYLFIVPRLDIVDVSQDGALVRFLNLLLMRVAIPNEHSPRLVAVSSAAVV
jgi:hypothetical protein